MNHPSENASSSDHFSGFNKLNHEELLARGMMSDAFSMDMSQWQAPEPEDLENLLTGYQVLGFLGRGGMGAVYRVLQPDLERECALKLLPLEVSIAPGFEQRFLQEARAMAKLDHPNIVTIYDFGRTSEGHLYYVMECVEGTDLHALIKDGGLDLSGALDVVSQVCEALDYAHSTGYVHRDIKPANILVNTKGIVKVTDFGLAKLLNQDSPDYGMTMTGQVMGTPDYMAPEQAHGHKVDQRADIYALGVLLYEMLTGSLPKGVFSPPSQKVDVDVRLDEVVIRALQQEPEKRYQQASDIKTSIDQIRQDTSKLNAKSSQNLAPESTAQKPTKTKSSHPKWRIPLATLLCLFIVGGVAWYSLRSSNDTKTKTPATSSDNDQILDTSLWPEQDEKHTNTLGIPFVPVSGTDVLFSVWETRRKDWDKFLRETDYQWEKPSFNGPGNHPVPNISWHDANAYCKWLTEKERASGNIGPNMEYRLPTDLEWSAAVGLGKENEKDPETRSAKVKDLYPWDKNWPPPEAIAKELDTSGAIDIVTTIKKGKELFSKQPKTDREYANFANYMWKRRLLTEPYSFAFHEAFYPIYGLLGVETSAPKHINGKTYIIASNLMLGHLCRYMVRGCKWRFANWTDSNLRAAVESGKFELGNKSEYWTGARWEKSKWIYKETEYTRNLFSEDQYYSENNELVAKIINQKVMLMSAPSEKHLKAVLEFEGELSSKQIEQEILLGYEKFRVIWRTGAIPVIDKLLPKYENDWQQKIQPVDQLWENPFGIKGLAGSQREWVSDQYNSQNDKTLRGGTLRSDARGPQLSTLPKGDKKLEAFCQGVVPAKTAFLSSHRGHAKPATRKPWNGFRPVLAFTK